MASADTMLTSDIIRQGASKTQQKTTKTENALLRDVKKRLEAMEMKSWADSDILERARELGAAASVDRLVTEIIDDPEKSSWQSQGRSNEGKKPAPRPSASSTTRGPRGPRTGGKFEEGQSRRSNGAEGGDKFEHRRSGKFGDRKNEDSPQNGHRDENRRANGEHRGRHQDKGAYGEREGKQQQQQQQKPVAPAVPATTWTSIVKKNLPTASVSEETVVVSGKDASQKEQSANSKNTKGNNKNKANSQPSSLPSEPTTTTTTTTEASPSPVEAAPVEVAPVEVPIEPVAVETPIVETPSPAVDASPAASVADKKEENVTGGRGRRAGGRNNRREKEAVSPVENGETASPQAQEPAAETPAAAAQSKSSGAKVILPSAFSGVSNQPTRRGFASSHVKVTPSAPAATAPAAAAAPVAVAPAPTPVAVASVAATAPEAQLLATAPASATVAAPPAAANPVATTVPPALTSSLPPHMTGSHNSMPHGMFPNMNMHYPGQFFQPQEYFQPEMYSHMMGPYPPFMPMGTGPRNTHDNKSPASTNPQSTNPSGPSLNSQSGAMPPMFPPYMMNPLPYYMPFPAAMQSQGPNTGSNNGHYNPQQSRYASTGGRAPSNPTPTYDHQEESHFYQPRSGYTDPYSSGGYPSSHHGQSHAQEQKPYGQDPNKSYDDHSHAYNAFGHSGSFSH